MDVHRGWSTDVALFALVRGCFHFGCEDRATGYLDEPWITPLLDRLDVELDVRFTIVAFQGYRHGAGCDWHADTPFDTQAILSLGVTRTFGYRPTGGEPTWVSVHDGDLLVMPAGFQRGWEHCVPNEDIEGERCSLVFRTSN